jgi:hypothetical protein
MENNFFVQFISEDLDLTYSCKLVSIPAIGGKIWIDDKLFTVCDIQTFLYTGLCQNNKVRIYLDKVEDF